MINIVHCPPVRSRWLILFSARCRTHPSACVHFLPFARGVLSRLRWLSSIHRLPLASTSAILSSCSLQPNMSSTIHIARWKAATWSWSFSINRRSVGPHSRSWTSPYVMFRLQMNPFTATRNGSQYVQSNIVCSAVSNRWWKYRHAWHQARSSSGESIVSEIPVSCKILDYMKREVFIGRLLTHVLKSGRIVFVKAALWPWLHLLD